MSEPCRLLSYNILDGAPGARLDQVCEVILALQPDIVCLQECNGWQADGLRRFRQVSERLGLPGFLARANSAYNLSVFSRYESDRFVNHRAAGLGHTFCDVVFRTPGGSRLRVVNLHFNPHSEQTRLRELGALLAVTADWRDELTACCGDFNSLAPGDSYDGHPVETVHEHHAKLTIPLQIEVQPRLRDAGWVDAFRLASTAPGYTCPAQEPVCRIDYCYLSPALSQHLVDCRPVQDAMTATASDHLPLLTCFELPESTS